MFVLVLGCSCCGQPNAVSVPQKGATIPSDVKTREGAKNMTLQIDLQNGFSNDEVVIRVDGKTVFQRAGVTTDALLAVSRGED